MVSSIARSDASATVAKKSAAPRSPKRHLLGSFPDKLERPAVRRPWICELHLIRSERGDNAFLIGPEEVRVRTPLNVGSQDLICLVDRVRAKVGNRSCHYGFGFFRGRPRTVRARELR